jgi:Ca2+-transporting ATPase
MNNNLATIIRDNGLVNIDADNLQVGDIVVLQTADIVPADLKLVEANGLEVDEFDITGELLPVEKEVGEEVILYAGSKVTRGTGKGIVVAVGEETEYGKVLNQVWEQDQPDRSRLIEKKYLLPVLLLLPSLILQMMRSTNVIGMMAVYAILAIMLIALQNNEYFKRVLVSSERRKLEDCKIQIRDVKALERMGNIDTLCFDKTGVLTTRQMEVRNLYLADGMIAAESASAIDTDAFRWIKTACALCNDVSFWEKLEQANPVDKALIAFATNQGIDVKEWLAHYQRIYDKPFDPESRHMIAGFEMEGRQVYFAKGDSEIIQKMCSSYVTMSGDRKKMDSDFWRSNRLNIEAINQSGGTAIALAYSETSRSEFTFLCLLQLENPLQVGATGTIETITENGIRSILLTGDRAETAVNVAEASGIARESTAPLLGRTLERMETHEIIKQSAYCSIFARLLPSQKGFLIRLLQQDGHCVGMVGDGVNDSIALKAADVGISFAENSSPVARRFAHILINTLDDLALLVESAKRIKRRIRQSRMIRIGIMAISLIGVYVWALMPIIFGR